MINKLISLALLIFFLTITNSSSENDFLYPQKKPSVFKKIEKNTSSEIITNLPQKKPIIKDIGKKEIKDKIQKIEADKISSIKILKVKIRVMINRKLIATNNLIKLALSPITKETIIEDNNII